MGKSYKDRGRTKYIHEQDSLDGHFSKKHGRHLRKSARQEAKEWIREDLLLEEAKNRKDSTED